MPRSQHEKHPVIVRIFWLDGLVNCDGSVDVLLVPQAVNQHGGHLQGLDGEDSVDGLSAPVLVIAGMLEDLFPESSLLHAVPAPDFSRGPALQEFVVVIVM